MNDDQLREQIEGLRLTVPSHLDPQAYNRALDDVLDLLAERGATTREPDGLNPFQRILDAWQDKIWGIGQIPRVTREAMATIVVETLFGEALQGATGTAQHSTPAAKAGTQVGEAAHDDWGSRRCPQCGGLFGDCVTCEGSPQPAEPRDIAPPCPKCGDRIAEPALSRSWYCSTCEIDEGGDTITPEPETAQEAEPFASLTAQEVETLRQTLRASSGGYEAEWYRTAYREGVDTVCNVLSDMVKSAARRALVGEEAP